MKKNIQKKPKSKTNKIKKNKMKKTKMRNKKKSKSISKQKKINKPFMELLYFHMDGCGFCNKFEPIWENLKKKLKGINLVKINGPKNKNLARKFKVSGYPTIILIKGKYNIVYQGKRDVNSLIKFYNMINKNASVITKNIRGKKYIVN